MACYGDFRSVVVNAHTASDLVFWPIRHVSAGRPIDAGQHSGSCVRKDVGVQVPPRPPPLTCGFVFGKAPQPVVEPADCNPIATIRSAQRCDTRRHPPASDDPPCVGTTLGRPNLGGQACLDGARAGASEPPAGARVRVHLQQIAAIVSLCLVDVALLPPTNSMPPKTLGKPHAGSQLWRARSSRWTPPETASTCPKG